MHTHGPWSHPGNNRYQFSTFHPVVPSFLDPNQMPDRSRCLTQHLPKSYTLWNYRRRVEYLCKRQTKIHLGLISRSHPLELLAVCNPCKDNISLRHIIVWKIAPRLYLCWIFILSKHKKVPWVDPNHDRQNKQKMHNYSYRNYLSQYWGAKTSQSWYLILLHWLQELKRICLGKQR